MIIEFELGVAERPIEGVLVYRQSEHSFDFEPKPGGGANSISVADLEIQIDDTTGRALYVWGYHPSVRWERAILRPPAGRPGSLFVRTSEPLVPGKSVRIEEHRNIATKHDPESGWVCVRLGDFQDEHLIEFAQGVVAGLHGRELSSLWLHPTTKP